MLRWNNITYSRIETVMAIILTILLIISVLALNRVIENNRVEDIDVMITNEQVVEVLKQEIKTLREENAKYREQNTELNEQLKEFMDKFTIAVFEVSDYAPLDPQAIEGMCYSGDPSITASGAKVVPGVTVAAGPEIPFGTKIWIEGVGWRTVQDRGKRITEGKLDIAVWTRREAFKWGRRKVKVIFREG